MNNKTSLNLSDQYQLYIDECKKYGFDPIEKDQYLKIVNEYFNDIKDLVINKQLPYTFPCWLGDICVYKHKQRKPQIDWQYYHKTGKCVKNNNMNTNGWTFMTRWLFPSNRARNDWFQYTLRFSRRCWKKLVSNKVLEGQDYEEYDGRKINKC